MRLDADSPRGGRPPHVCAAAARAHRGRPRRRSRADWQKALEISGASEFDVMVLDVMLPELDGFGVVRRMRAAGNRYASADADRARRQRGRGPGTERRRRRLSDEAVLVRHAAGAAASAGAPRAVGPRRRAAGRGPDARCSATHQAARSGTALALTRTEFSLLEYLDATRRPRGDTPGLDRGGLGTATGRRGEHPRRIRPAGPPQGGRPGRPPLIHTIRGVGYSIRSDA